MKGGGRLGPAPIGRDGVWVGSLLAGKCHMLSVTMARRDGDRVSKACQLGDFSALPVGLEEGPDVARRDGAERQQALVEGPQVEAVPLALARLAQDVRQLQRADE